MESRVITGATIRGLALPPKPAARLAGNCSFPSVRLNGKLSDGGNLIWGRQLRPAILLEASPAIAFSPVTKRGNLRPCLAAASSPADSGDSAGFVSVIHLFVGVVYCSVSWAVGLPKRAPIDSNLLKLLIPVAVCHALGHVTSNVSFATVAVSFTHTIKGDNTDMDSTNLYAYISIIALIVCIPPALIVSPHADKWQNCFSNVHILFFIFSSNVFLIYSITQVEGPQLMKHGFNDAIAKVGMTKFITDLFWVGMFYHLYNQLATNTLERVAPLTHAVGNVLKRVFVIGFSILVFGNKISLQTGIGTSIAIAGVAAYSLIKAKLEEEKRR
ncbi:hypothetical protein DH2020_032785 [Rehmannia glutinosa]|uniref:Sugar phosphate transporter domain-containing protein n=1 Tax=Rehmannia glutinosa TaxID=99300 RepID=A0ABR0VF05_REHGL